MAELQRLLHRARRLLRRPLPGSFQPYNHTLPDRYPWLFSFAASQLADHADLRLLSFGCSHGEEVTSLRRYFPRAFIKGLDIDPRNIEICRRHALANAEFAVAGSAEAEAAASYDSVLCLAVLCHGDLVAANPPVCTPLVDFADFERVVTGLARCLKPGGLLFLHTNNFRFADTAVAAQFCTILEAPAAEMAPDRHYGPDNHRLDGPTSRAVGFRKRFNV